LTEKPASYFVVNTTTMTHMTVLRT